MNQAKIESYERCLQRLIESVKNGEAIINKARLTSKWYQDMDKMIDAIKWKIRVLKRFTKRQVYFRKDRNYFLV